MARNKFSVYQIKMGNLASYWVKVDDGRIIPITGDCHPLYPRRLIRLAVENSGSFISSNNSYKVKQIHHTDHDEREAIRQALVDTGFKSLTEFVGADWYIWMARCPNWYNDDNVDRRIRETNRHLDLVERRELAGIQLRAKQHAWS